MCAHGNERCNNRDFVAFGLGEMSIHFFDVARRAVEVKMLMRGLKLTLLIATFYFYNVELMKRYKDRQESAALLFRPGWQSE